MRKLLILLVILGLPSGALAAGGHKSCGTVECDRVNIDLGDKASLQNGARIFVNFCLSCHSASYICYTKHRLDRQRHREIVAALAERRASAGREPKDGPSPATVSA